MAGVVISVICEALHRARRRFDVATRQQEQAAGALRRQADLLEQSHDAIFVWELAGTITFWNRGAEALYGFSKSEAVGRVSHELLQTQRALTTAQFEEALQREGRWEGELKHTAKDGRNIVVASRHIAVQRAGERAYVMEINRDITEQRRVEEATLRALERLHEAQRIGKIGDWEWDVATQAITWSPEVFVIFGRDPALGPPRSYEENAAVFEPASAALMAEKVAAVIATGTAQEYEVVARHPGGERIVVQARALPRKDGEGKVVGLYGTVQDITERHRAERLIRESEERLGFALTAAGIGDWDMDLRTNATRRSLRHDQCFGYSEPVPEWGYETILAHVQAEDRARVDATFQEAMASGGDYDVEFRVVWPDGSRHWLWSKGKFYFDDVGLPYRVAGIQMDVTARKTTEEALRKSAQEQRGLVSLLEKERAKLLAAQEVARIGSWETEAATGQVAWSAETHRIFETDPANFRPTHSGFLKLVHPDDRTRVDDAFQKGLTSHAPAAIEHRIVMADGRIKTVEERWQTHFDDREQPTTVVGTCQDITERRQAEAAALRLAAIVESSDDAIVGKDLDGFITSWNAGAEKLFGYTATEMVGASILWIIPPDRHAEEAVILGTIAAGKTIRQFETVRVRKDGSCVDVAVTISPIRDPAGRIVGASKVARDITDQKKAADELRRSEASLAHAQHIARIGSWNLEIASGALSWSDEIYEIFGLDPAEFGASYEAFLATVHPEDRARLDAAQRAAVAGEARLDFEHRIVRPDGTERVVHELADLTRDAAGRRARLTGTVQDITGRVQAEAKLRESEERFSAAFQASPMAMVITTLEGFFVEVNDAYCRLIGLPREEIIGRTIADLGLLGASDRQEIVTTVEGAGGTLGGLEFDVERRDGRPLSVIAGVTEITLGGVRHRLSTALDVTEQRRAERALRASEERYRRLFETARDGIVILDATSGMVMDVNPHLLTILGVPEDQFLNKVVWEVAFFKDVVGDRNSFAKLRDKDYLRVPHLPLETVSGAHVEVEFISSVYEVSDRKVIQCSVRDVTARRQAEQALRQLNSTLEQRVAERTAQLEAANRELEAYASAVSNDLRVAEAADRIKSAFLATMSHELRTPLNSIIGFTGIVLLGKAGPLNEEQAKQLGMVRESAWHLLALINDVLDLSKIEAGQMNVSAAPFDLPASIARVMAMISPLAKKKSLSLTAEVAPELGAMVSDPRRVEQILLNLLTNAVKFTDHGGVTLAAELVAEYRPPSAAEAGPAVRLRVADTGIGILTEDLARLFQPFSQLDSGMDRHTEGTGLGLVISRRLATLLGGEITAASTWSEGSEFSVTLPLQKPSAP